MNLKNIKVKEEMHLTSILHFGPYKGETVDEVIEKDVKYIETCMEDIHNFRLSNAAFDKFSDKLEQAKEIDLENEYYNEQL